MKIVIVGAGQVGFHIAGHLVNEGHDVLLIERDEATLNRALDNLDVQGLRGHGARPNVLEEAGIAEADMLLAVRSSDEVNMVACMNAAILGRPDIIKVARVREESYQDPRIFHDPRVAIDLAINPERVTADIILALLRFPSVTQVIDFADGRAKLMGIQVEPTSPLVGLRFLDFADRFRDLEHRFLVGAIHRGDEMIIPRGTDVVLPGDEVEVVVRAEDVDEVLAALGVPVMPALRVMISGGTKIGRFLATDLAARGVKPKLIAQDARLAGFLGESLTNTIVLHGHPTDAELLEQENISEMQAFIACSADEEANVMSALLARRLGARRVIATTNRRDYRPLMRSIGIDVSISPQQVAISSILHFIRHGRVVAARALDQHSSAEALEFEAKLASGVAGTPLHALRLPPNCLVACIQRGEEVVVPDGEFVIEDGDRVIVIAAHDEVRAVEKILASRLDAD